MPHLKLNLWSRPARLEDLEDILQIDTNVADGYDYIYHKLNHFLTSGRHYPVVLLDSTNKVVGFNSVHLLDSAQTIVMQSGRLTPELRIGKSLLENNYKIIFNQLNSRQPRLDLLKMNFVNSSRYTAAQPRSNKKLLFQQNFLSLEMSRSELENVISNNQLQKLRDVQQLSVHRLKTLFQSWQRWDVLTYAGWLVAGYDIFQPRFCENAHVVFDTNESFATHDVHTDDLTALSFLEEVTTPEVQDFTYYVANVFTGCDLSTGESLLLSHLDAHFNHMRARLSEHKASRVGYLIYFHCDLSVERLRNFCHENYGFHEGRVRHDAQHTHRNVSSYEIQQLTKSMEEVDMQAKL